MTNSPSSAGNSLSLPEEHDWLALAEIPPDAASPCRYSGFHDLSPGDTSTWHLYSRWLAETDRISNREGPLTDEDISASLALTQGLARRILKEPLVRADEIIIKFVAFCHLSSAAA